MYDEDIAEEEIIVAWHDRQDAAKVRSLCLAESPQVLACQHAMGAAGR